MLIDIYTDEQQLYFALKIKISHNMQAGANMKI